AAGKMTVTASSDLANNDGVTTDALIDGATYRNAFTIDSAAAGTAQIFIGSGSGTVRSTAGTFSQDIVYADSGDPWFIQFTSATMQLDSFSVKSVGLLGVEADWTFTGDT